MGPKFDCAEQAPGGSARSGLCRASTAVTMKKKDRTAECISFPPIADGYLGWSNGALRARCQIDKSEGRKLLTQTLVMPHLARQKSFMRDSQASSSNSERLSSQIVFLMNAIRLNLQQLPKHLVRATSL